MSVHTVLYCERQSSAIEFLESDGHAGLQLLTTERDLAHSQAALCDIMQYYVTQPGDHAGLLPEWQPLALLSLS